jgi:hypothetical protein
VRRIATAALVLGAFLLGLAAPRPWSAAGEVEAAKQSKVFRCFGNVVVIHNRSDEEIAFQFEGHQPNGDVIGPLDSSIGPGETRGHQAANTVVIYLTLPNKAPVDIIGASDTYGYGPCTPAK